MQTARQQVTHPLLQNQLERHAVPPEGPVEAEGLQEFIGTVDAAYQEFERERIWEETVHAKQSRILELIAGGAPLADVLVEIIRMVESQSPEMLCSFVMADNGVQNGPQHGLPATWSLPILSRQGKELATFSAYHNPPRHPTLEELKLLELASRIGGIAIQRYHADSVLRQTEEDLRQAQKMEAIARLARGIAHDFNNMLTAIQGNVAMIGIGGLTAAEQETAIADALHAVERATVLTQQLVTFSRRNPLELQSLDLNEVVAGMTKLLQRLIGEHISLEAHFAPTEAAVHADRSMIEQVLMNLALNSREAMPEAGNLVLRTEIVAITEAEAARRIGAWPAAKAGTFVRLGAGDSGDGIEPEALARIFEPYAAPKEVGKGAGLGLATVFSIVQQHGGWTEVESVVGRGTTFQLYLPQTTKAPVSLNPPRASSERPFGTETVLLVEDELEVRSLMKSILTKHGYKVLAAESGPAALAIWEQHSPAIELLVTDIVMPLGITGEALARRLRSERPSLKVIQCSAYSTELLSGQNPRERAGLLLKPFDPIRLLQMVRETLDGA